MQMTEHKTESIYRRYGVFSLSDLKEAVNEQAAFHEVPQDKREDGLLKAGIGELLESDPEQGSQWTN